MAVNAHLRRLLSDERGATAVEYGLICVLMVLAIIGIVQAMANEINAMWGYVGENIDEAVE